jgi:hypothetical protein
MNRKINDVRVLLSICNFAYENFRWGLNVFMKRKKKCFCVTLIVDRFLFNEVKLSPKSMRFFVRKIAVNSRILKAKSKWGCCFYGEATSLGTLGLNHFRIVAKS